MAAIRVLATLAVKGAFAELAARFQAAGGAQVEADFAPTLALLDRLRRGEAADVVILTNLGDHRQEARARQLSEIGIGARVITNQGPKGPAVKAILAEYQPTRALFIDDLPQHHGSVAAMAPQVVRLHLCGEPLLAPHIDCAHKAGHAHARIDDWAAALPWLLDRLQGAER